MTRVLVVDDEPIVREVVVSYLEREGYQTLEAGDGEAARAVIEREAPGISEWMRVSAAWKVRAAALSRGVSGTRGRTLIVNLPGSPGGVKDSLAALDGIVEHAVAVLRGEIADHDKGKEKKKTGRAR